MSAFTKGQKVTVREGAKSLTGQPPNSAVRTVAHPEYHDVEHPGDWVYLEDDTGDYAVGHIFLAADVTPAPLDPTAVRAGDTVTLSVDETSTRGPVKEIKYAGGGEWDIWIANHAHPFRAGRLGLWGVTDHQPAPEPEPEFLSGDVAVIETEQREGDQRRAVRRGGVWHFLDMEGYAIDAYVTDVRSLVVIDPAAARKALEDNGWGEHAVTEILHQTGIEAS